MSLHSGSASGRPTHIVAPTTFLRDLVRAMDNDVNEYPIFQRLVIRSQAERPDNPNDTRNRNRTAAT